MIARILEQTIQEKLGQGKAIIIMGPRQVGKTTLLKQMFTDSNDILWLNGDEQDTTRKVSLAKLLFPIPCWIAETGSYPETTEEKWLTNRLSSIGASLLYQQ